VDFDRVFAQMASDRPDAVLTTSDPAHQTHMPEVIDFFLKNRIAGLFQVREHVVAGGLMSYGVSLSDLFRMGALYTDKILRGSKPEDLPIAQPVSFEFIINRKTAKAIGLEIPATVIARADEVIECDGASSSHCSGSLSVGFYLCRKRYQRKSPARSCAD
jgi:putative tryptophan/tyrosine transport system substrate-binding protein